MFSLKSINVGFVVNKVILERVFSEYLGFFCNSESINFTYHPGVGMDENLRSKYQKGSVLPQFKNKKHKFGSLRFSE